jgi:serine protease Do
MSETDDGGYYILTNAHVIYDDESDYECGEAVAVSVVIEGEDGSEDSETNIEAKIVAYDLDTDVAVLEIGTQPDSIEPAEFGDSDQLKVGEMVVAIGNPLGFELYNTVTCGIVSALNRNITINEKQMTLIQTDAAINSGNSGGPLINGSGQVIGINSSKMSSSYSSSEATIEGLGFAIPIKTAADIANDLINYGYVSGKPQFGLVCRNIDESVSQAYNLPVGAYVTSVTSGSAAEKAGIQQGDVITAINDVEITTIEELNSEKNNYSAGDTVTLTLVRAGQEMKVDVVLDEKKGTDETTTTEETTAASQAQQGFGW